MFFLGYENNGFADGAGAQIQRILGIYSVSRLLGCGYLHLGLNKIGYQGLSVLESGVEISNLVELYNRLISLPSDGLAISDFDGQTFFEKSPTLTDILKLREQSMMRGRPALLLLHLPFAVADSFPDAYASVHGVINETTFTRLSGESFFGELNRRNGEEVVVAVHVRRGELLAVESHRMLANDYYVAVCNEIARLLGGAGLSFRFDLYTEVPRAPFAVDGNSHWIGNQIQERVQLSPDQLGMKDFDQIVNIRYRINEHPVSTLFNMASSDILVGSRSSYSYVAAVAGTVKCVVMPRFWHAPKTDWIEVLPETGTLDVGRLSAALERVSIAK